MIQRTLCSSRRSSVETNFVLYQCVLRLLRYKGGCAFRCFPKQISSISHHLTICDPLRDTGKRCIDARTRHFISGENEEDLLSYSKVLINKETFMANHGSFPRDFHKEFSEQGNSYLVK